MVQSYCDDIAVSMALACQRYSNVIKNKPNSLSYNKLSHQIVCHQAIRRGVYRYTYSTVITDYLAVVSLYTETNPLVTQPHLQDDN